MMQILQAANKSRLPRMLAGMAMGVIVYGVALGVLRGYAAAHPIEREDYGTVCQGHREARSYYPHFMAGAMVMPGRLVIQLAVQSAWGFLRGLYWPYGPPYSAMQEIGPVVVAAFPPAGIGVALSSGKKGWVITGAILALLWVAYCLLSPMVYFSLACLAVMD
jgi:hypothetical protein